MKIRDGFILRKMDDMSIVVAVGSAAKEFNGIITLNSTAEFMWKQLEKGCTEEELVCEMLKTYNAPEEKMRGDAAAFVKKLREAELLDE